MPNVIVDDAKQNLRPAAKGVYFTTANTNRDGSGTVQQVDVAAGTGLRIDWILFIAEGITTAGMIRIFVDAGSGWKLVGEVGVTAVPSPGATTAVWTDRWVPDGGLMVLPTGAKLGVTTHNGEAFVAHVEGVHMLEVAA